MNSRGCLDQYKEDLDGEDDRVYFLVFVAAVACPIIRIIK